MPTSRIIPFRAAGSAAALLLLTALLASAAFAADPDPLLGPRVAPAPQQLSVPAPAKAPSFATAQSDGSIELASEYGWNGQTTNQGPYAVVRYVVPRLPNGVNSLNSVKIAIPKPQMSYEVRIYRDFDGRGPVGAILDQETGYAANAGMLSVPLHVPVPVAQGETLCIWVKIVGSTGTVATALSLPIPIIITDSTMEGAPAVTTDWSMRTPPASWLAQGQWEYGSPEGNLGGGVRDPNSGVQDPYDAGDSGVNVYGYNLSGDYSNSMPTTEYLRTSAIDCSLASEVALRFQRWLGVADASDTATLQVSNNGSTWYTIYQNTGPVTDTRWTQFEYDISSVAAGYPAVYIRWGMGPTNATGTSCGWNIDDVQILTATESHVLDAQPHLDVEMDDWLLLDDYGYYRTGFSVFGGDSLYMLEKTYTGKPMPIESAGWFRLTLDKKIRKVLPFGMTPTSLWDAEDRFIAFVLERTQQEADYNFVYDATNRPLHVLALKGQEPVAVLPFMVHDIYNPWSPMDIQLPLWKDGGVPGQDAWPDHPSLPAGYDVQRRMMFNDVALAAYGNFLFMVSNRYQDRFNGTSYRFWWDLHVTAWDLTDPYNPTMAMDRVFARTSLQSGYVTRHMYWYFDYDNKVVDADNLDPDYRDNGRASFAVLPPFPASPQQVRLGGFGYVLDAATGTATPTDLLDKNVKLLDSGTIAASAVNALDWSPRPSSFVDNPPPAGRFTRFVPGDPGDVIFSDVSQNPPALVSRLDAGIDIPVPANDTVSVGDTMYVADAQAGLTVVNIADPSSPQPLVGYMWNNANAQSVEAIVGGGYTHVYIASQPNEAFTGLQAGAIWLPFNGSVVDFGGTPPPSFSTFLSPSGEKGSWTNINVAKHATVPVRAIIGAGDDSAGAGTWMLFE